MDVVSHALWGGLVFGGSDSVVLAATFGAAPDLIPFVPFVLREAIHNKRISPLKPDIQAFPSWTFKLYNYTHSLISYLGIFLICYWLFSPAVARLSLGWLLHILMDIPTHEKKFFPTEFLFPLSDFSFDGIPWSRGSVMLGNYLALVLVFLLK